MLQVINLTVTYSGKQLPVFEDISFTLQEGDLLQLSGANGSGKTTLLYAMCNVIPLETEAIRSGKVIYDKRDMTILPLNQMIPDIMLAMHNPAWQLFFPTVQDEIVYALENMGLDSEEIAMRLNRALRTFHLESLAKTNPATLSLGVQKLLVMAVMEAIQPKVLLLDEPLNNLSTDNKALVTNWIKDFCYRDGIIIAAEHSTFINNLNPIVLHLPDGKRD